MAIFHLLLLFLLPPTTTSSTLSPYLSPTTLSQNYQTMLTTFKIFIYTPPKPFNYTSTPTSLFYNSLLHSPFLTQDPTQAHLFFLPFPTSTTTRSLARVIRDLRTNYPYWNRSLGADHFFVSPTGIDYSSDRNILELKKNSVQVSNFPVTSGFFIPHKDITLPPFFNPTTSFKESNSIPSFLGFLKWDGKTESRLVNEIKEMDGFLVDEESDSSGSSDYLTSVGMSKFCLFLYYSDVSWMVEAMGYGCVPVVIVDRPIQDLPLMDVLRWSEMVLLVLVESAGRLREVLSGVSEERYREMMELGVAASKHLQWKAAEEAAECGAFGMVMYQLWLRRHVIRYSRRDV